MTYVKAKKWSAWHIARVDGHTVCGRPIPSPVLKNESAWTHLLCIICWNTRHPEKRSYDLDRLEGPPCCACGAATSSGIYVRAQPDGLQVL